MTNFRNALTGFTFRMLPVKVNEEEMGGNRGFCLGMCIVLKPSLIPTKQQIM
jgi:hypothetical protein